MRIIIPGKPIPKQRARYSKRGKHVITYDPQEKDKKRIKEIIALQLFDFANSLDKRTYIELGNICTSRVFSVSFIFFLPVNDSDSVSTKNKKLWGFLRANSKPDYDNLEKFYLDCANGLLWNDDSYVVKAQAVKLYSEEPRVEIVVNAVDEIKVSKNVESVITAFSPSEFREFQEYAHKISQISQPNMDDIQDSMLEDWIVSSACILSQFAQNFATKLNKISKMGDITSEVKEFNEIKRALEA